MEFTNCYPTVKNTFRYFIPDACDIKMKQVATLMVASAHIATCCLLTNYVEYMSTVGMPVYVSQKCLFLWGIQHCGSMGLGA